MSASSSVRSSDAANAAPSIDDYMADVGANARRASRLIAAADTGAKSRALNAIAAAIDGARQRLVEANAEDVRCAREAAIDQPLIDRLVLDTAGIDRMIEGIRQVDSLTDPVGEITDLSYRPTGIQVGKMRVPLGVIGIIYESRPNVTADAASLCIKSSNACILRGGSEAFQSNTVIADCVRAGLSNAGLDPDIVQLVATTDRAAVGALLKQDAFVDVIVPRGGRSLIERISNESKIPVIKHLDGVCHVYVHSEADLDMALEIAVNSKTSKYAVCNALETLLIDADVADEFLPRAAARFAEAGVTLRGCERTSAQVAAEPATEDDWYAEFLGPTLAVRIVDGLDTAIDHINTYGSAHTDAIVTGDYTASRRFVTEVDSASVMVNASTQFADGFEFGLGAEIGISTDKLHARGPVGLEGLTTQKFVVFGNGETRQR